MRQVDTFVNEHGKIYVNIVDLILTLKDTVERAKEQNLDTTVIEGFFLWLAREHTKTEQAVEEAKKKEKFQRSQELLEYWNKYREGNGEIPGQPDNHDQKNPD